MHLLAGVFTGFGLFLHSILGGHFGASPEDAQRAASTTPRIGHMASSTEDGHRGVRMGSTTPGMRPMISGHEGSTTPEGRPMLPPGIIGKVVSISGTTLTVNGRAGDQATTTYAVDASSAKVALPRSGNTNASLSDVKAGDAVVVSGPISGTSITAKLIIDGLPPALRPAIKNEIKNNLENGGPRPPRPEHMGTTTQRMHPEVSSGN